MFSKFKRLAVFVAIGAIASSSNSATFGSAFGEVGELAAGGIGTGAPSKNLVYFTITGTATFATCATSSAPHFVINADDAGKTMVSLLLAAKMAGKKVHVAGRGSCTNIAGHEDVSLIYID